MKSLQHFTARTDAITVGVRATHPRAGTTHDYVLNSTLMRDVQIDGQWITVSAKAPVESLTA